MSIVKNLRAACIAFTVLPLAVFGQTNEAQDLARKLVNALKYKSQFEAQRTQCRQGALTAPAESLVRQNPEKFGGITPSSPHWGKVVKAYGEYWHAYCARPTAGEFVDAIAQVYAKEMSVAELTQTLAFLSSDAGTKLVAANQKSSQEAVSLAVRLATPEAMKAEVSFVQRLREIVLESEADKKSCPTAAEFKANRALEARFPDCPKR